MIDTKDIGSRIRALRLKKEMSQEELADLVGIKTAHMSHIETGNAVPGLRVFIDIVNALGCSADDLLCIEIANSRPRFLSWLDELLSDCNSQELKVITSNIRALKDSLREFGFGCQTKR